jgi:hypothetical protein
VHQPEATVAMSTGKTEPSYAAFISYSHADDKMARWLHRRLESYVIPSGIASGRGVKSVLGRRIGKVVLISTQS